MYFLYRFLMLPTSNDDSMIVRTVMHWKVALKNGQSYQRVAKDFGVPRKTLQRHFKGTFIQQSTCTCHRATSCLSRQWWFFWHQRLYSLVLCHLKLLGISWSCWNYDIWYSYDEYATASSETVGQTTTLSKFYHSSTGRSPSMQIICDATGRSQLDLDHTTMAPSQVHMS